MASVCLRAGPPGAARRGRASRGPPAAALRGAAPGTRPSSTGPRRGGRCPSSLREMRLERASSGRAVRVDQAVLLEAGDHLRRVRALDALALGQLGRRQRAVVGRWSRAPPCRVGLSGLSASWRSRRAVRATRSGGGWPARRWFPQVITLANHLASELCPLWVPSSMRRWGALLGGDGRRGMAARSRRAAVGVPLRLPHCRARRGAGAQRRARRSPHPAFGAAQAITGVVLGAYLKTSSLEAAADAWLPVTLVSAGTLAICLAAGALLAPLRARGPADGGARG